MSDLRKTLVLPPAQQIEELTKDVNELQERITEIYTILNNMAAAFIEHDQMLKELGQLVLIMRREGNGERQLPAEESNTGSDRVEGSSVEGSSESGVGDTIHD